MNFQRNCEENSLRVPNTSSVDPSSAITTSNGQDGFLVAIDHSVRLKSSVRLKEEIRMETWGLLDIMASTFLSIR